MGRCPKMEDVMQHFEITLHTTAQGWHWSVTVERDGRRVLVAESDCPLSSAIEAAAEAEANTAEFGNSNGLNVRFMPWISKQFPWTVCFRHEPSRGFATYEQAKEYVLEEQARRTAKAA